MQVRDQNRNRRSLGVLALVCALVQLAIVPNIGIASGRANVALVFAALSALTVGGRTGVLAGFLAGLFFDLTTTGPVGLMSLLLTIASYVLGSEERNRLADEPAGSFVIFAVVSLVVTLAYHLAMLLVGEPVSLLDAVLMRTLPTYALTLIAYIPIAFFLTRDRSASGPLSSRGTSSNLGISTGKHTRGGGLHMGRP